MPRRRRSNKNNQANGGAKPEKVQHKQTKSNATAPAETGKPGKHERTHSASLIGGSATLAAENQFGEHKQVGMKAKQNVSSHAQNQNNADAAAELAKIATTEKAKHVHAGGVHGEMSSESKEMESDRNGGGGGGVAGKYCYCTAMIDCILIYLL
jgi:hypothetical protein